MVVGNKIFPRPYNAPTYVQLLPYEFSFLVYLGEKKNEMFVNVWLTSRFGLSRANSGRWVKEKSENFRGKVGGSF